MNYRHAFHAGNFADVLKHVVMTRILLHLQRKEAPFLVMDTHAGAGAYRTDSDEAGRTGEWAMGIGRVLAADLPPALAELVEPWLSLVKGMMTGPPPVYPGSPMLAQELTRAQDRMVFCEKRPDDAALLKAAFRRDRRVTALEADGWLALVERLPPPERRGMVLIDPPYEQPREFAAIADGLEAAIRRWATGTYVVWYPVKGRREVDAFARKIAALPVAKVLRIEIGLYEIERVDRLNGCGLLVLNPPWQLDVEARVLADWLAALFAREGTGRHRVEWLKGE